MLRDDLLAKRRQIFFFFVSLSSNSAIILCVIAKIRPLYMPLYVIQLDHVPFRTVSHIEGSKIPMPRHPLLASPPLREAPVVGTPPRSSTTPVFAEGLSPIAAPSSLVEASTVPTPHHCVPLIRNC